MTFALEGGGKQGRLEYLEIVFCPFTPFLKPCLHASKSLTVHGPGRLFGCSLSPAFTVVKWRKPRMPIE